MNKEVYQSARKEMLIAAEAALELGDLEKFNYQKEAIDALDERYEEAVKAKANFNALNGTTHSDVLLFGTDKIGGNEYMNKQYEDRGNKLKDRKPVEYAVNELVGFSNAITIGSGDLVVPTHTSNTLNPVFNEVSSVVDVVKSVNLNGGESYKKGFIVGYGEGDYTSETGEYEDAEPTTDYVKINKTKVTAYAEISDEATKLPGDMYQEMIRESMVIALRKKVAKQIINGTGLTDTITGIYNAPVNVIPLASDITISEIDETTLDKIVFGYGGSEDVEGGAYLFLNKQDLAAFAAIRATDGKKLYKITIDENGNTGTISSDESYSVRYIINSACKALSDSTTTANSYTMVYGKPLSYELPLFSPMTVEESRDFKFKSGQVCYRGSVWVGGNVAAYKGFVRVKKTALPVEEE